MGCGYETIRIRPIWGSAEHRTKAERLVFKNPSIALQKQTVNSCTPNPHKWFWQGSSAEQGDRCQTLARAKVHPTIQILESISSCRIPDGVLRTLTVSYTWVTLFSQFT